MADRTCSIFGCDRPMWARTWCGTHYKRWRLTGSTDLVERQSIPCSVDGCEKVSRKRGWCNSHYHRWRVQGDVQASVPLRSCSPNPDGSRRCFRCQEVLPAERFTSNHRRGTCDECLRQERREFAAANPGYWLQWQRANPEKVSAIVHARRATREGRQHERIDRNIVFERDDFTCKLCGGALDMGAAKAHPLAPTLDHIVPLSRGGDHLYANVQAAHFRCNTAKGNRVS